jgi:hypothetical protein
MPFELRNLEDLAEELGGMAAAKKELRSRGVQVWEGCYNHGAYKAYEVEPKRSNIGRSKTAFSTLAESDGLGAIKHLMDALNLDIVLHQYHRTNWVTLRNAENKRTSVKVYVTQRYANQNGRANFSPSGFLSPYASGHYMFVCFEGPRAWVASRRDLIKMHRQVYDLKKERKDPCVEKVLPLGENPEGIRTRFMIPYKRRHLSEKDNKDGYIAITFDSNDEYRLLKASQLGL